MNLTKNKTTLRLITFIIIAAFLCENVVWAGGYNFTAGDRRIQSEKLANSSNCNDKDFQKAFQALELIKLIVNTAGDTIGNARINLKYINRWFKKPRGKRSRYKNAYKNIKIPKSTEPIFENTFLRRTKDGIWIFGAGWKIRFYKPSQRLETNLDASDKEFKETEKINDNLYYQIYMQTQAIIPKPVEGGKLGDGSASLAEGQIKSPEMGKEEDDNILAGVKILLGITIGFGLIMTYVPILMIFGLIILVPTAMNIIQNLTRENGIHKKESNKGGIGRRGFNIGTAAALLITAFLPLVSCAGKEDEKEKEETTGEIPKDPIEAAERNLEFLSSMIDKWNNLEVPHKNLILSYDCAGQEVSWVFNDGQAIAAFIQGYNYFKGKNAEKANKYLQNAVKIANTLVDIQESNGAWKNGYTASGVPYLVPQGGYYVGPNATVARAAADLLDLYETTLDENPNENYLNAAEKALDWIRKRQINSSENSVNAGAIAGGIDDSGEDVPWVSAEENIRAARALMKHWLLTENEKSYKAMLDIADWLITKMWNGERFYIGTYFDEGKGEYVINEGITLALDVQHLAIIFLSELYNNKVEVYNEFNPLNYKSALEWIRQFEYEVSYNGRGVRGYGKALDGNYKNEWGMPNENWPNVWVEGTLGQAYAERLMGNEDEYNRLINEMLKTFDSNTNSFPHIIGKEATGIWPADYRYPAVDSTCNFIYCVLGNITAMEPFYQRLPDSNNNGIGVKEVALGLAIKTGLDSKRQPKLPEVNSGPDTGAENLLNDAARVKKAKTGLTAFIKNFINTNQTFKKVIRIAEKEGKYFLIYVVIAEILHNTIPAILLLHGYPHFAVMAYAISLTPIYIALYFLVRAYRIKRMFKNGNNGLKANENSDHLRGGTEGGESFMDSGTPEEMNKKVSEAIEKGEFIQYTGPEVVGVESKYRELSAENRIIQKYIKEALNMSIYSEKRMKAMTESIRHYAEISKNQAEEIAEEILTQYDTFIISPKTRVLGLAINDFDAHYGGYAETNSVYIKQSYLADIVNDKMHFRKNSLKVKAIQNIIQHELLEFLLRKYEKQSSVKVYSDGIAHKIVTFNRVDNSLIRDNVCKLLNISNDVPLPVGGLIYSLHLTAFNGNNPQKNFVEFLSKKVEELGFSKETILKAFLKYAKQYNGEPPSQTSVDALVEIMKWIQAGKIAGIEEVIGGQEKATLTSDESEESLVTEDMPLYYLGQGLGIKFYVPVSAKKEGFWKYELKLTSAERQIFNEKVMPCYDSSGNLIKISIVFKDDKPLLMVAENIPWNEIPEDEREFFKSNHANKIEKLAFMHGEDPEEFWRGYESTLHEKSFIFGYYLISQTEIDFIRVTESARIWIEEQTRLIGMYSNALFSEYLGEDTKRPFIYFKGLYPPWMVASQVYQKLIRPKKGSKVCIIGTGTGVDAEIAAQRGAREVIANDIDPLGVACASYNISKSPYKDKITIVQGDLFNMPDRPKGEKYDTIYADLPLATSPELKKEFRDDIRVSDPGMMLLNRFLDEAEGHLNEGGTVVLMYTEDPEFLKTIYTKGWEPVLIDGVNFSRSRFSSDIHIDYAQFVLVPQKDKKLRQEELSSIISSLGILSEVLNTIAQADGKGSLEVIIEWINTVENIYNKHKNIKNYGDRLIAKSAHTILYILNHSARYTYGLFKESKEPSERGYILAAEQILARLSKIGDFSQRFSVTEPRINELYPEYLSEEEKLLITPKPIKNWLGKTLNEFAETLEPEKFSKEIRKFYDQEFIDQDALNRLADKLADIETLKILGMSKEDADILQDILRHMLINLYFTSADLEKYIGNFNRNKFEFTALLNLFIDYKLKSSKTKKAPPAGSVPSVFKKLCELEEKLQKPVTLKYLARKLKRSPAPETIRYDLNVLVNDLHLVEKVEPKNKREKPKYRINAQRAPPELREKILAILGKIYTEPVRVNKEKREERREEFEREISKIVEDLDKNKKIKIKFSQEIVNLYSIFMDIINSCLLDNEVLVNTLNSLGIGLDELQVEIDFLYSGENTEPENRTESIFLATIKSAEGAIMNKFIIAVDNNIITGNETMTIEEEYNKLKLANKADPKTWPKPYCFGYGLDIQGNKYQAYTCQYIDKNPIYIARDALDRLTIWLLDSDVYHKGIHNVPGTLQEVIYNRIIQEIIQRYARLYLKTGLVPCSFSIFEGDILMSKEHYNELIEKLSNSKPNQNEVITHLENKLLPSITICALRRLKRGSLEDLKTELQNYRDYLRSRVLIPENEFSDKYIKGKEIMFDPESIKLAIDRELAEKYTDQIEWVIGKPESMQRHLLKEALVFNNWSFVRDTFSNLDIDMNCEDIRKVEMVRIGTSRGGPDEEFKNVYAVRFYDKDGSSADVVAKIFNIDMYKSFRGMKAVKREIKVLRNLKGRDIVPDFGTYGIWGVERGELISSGREDSQDKFVVTTERLISGCDLRYAQKVFKLDKKQLKEIQKLAIEKFTQLWWFSGKHFYVRFSTEDPDWSHVRVFKEPDRNFDVRITDPGTLDNVINQKQLIEILCEYYPSITRDIQKIVEKTIEQISSSAISPSHTEDATKHDKIRKWVLKNTGVLRSKYLIFGGYEFVMPEVLLGKVRIYRDGVKGTKLSTKMRLSQEKNINNVLELEDVGDGIVLYYWLDKEKRLEKKKLPKPEKRRKRIDAKHIAPIQLFMDTTLSIPLENTKERKTAVMGLLKTTGLSNINSAYEIGIGGTRIFLSYHYEKYPEALTIYRDTDNNPRFVALVDSSNPDNYFILENKGDVIQVVGEDEIFKKGEIINFAQSGGFTEFDKKVPKWKEKEEKTDTFQGIGLAFSRFKFIFDEVCYIQTIATTRKTRVRDDYYRLYPVIIFDKAKKQITSIRVKDPSVANDEFIIDGMKWKDTGELVVFKGQYFNLSRIIDKVRNNEDSFSELIECDQKLLDFFEPVNYFMPNGGEKRVPDYVIQDDKIVRAKNDITMSEILAKKDKNKNVTRGTVYEAGHERVIPDFSETVYAFDNTVNSLVPLEARGCGKDTEDFQKAKKFLEEWLAYSENGYEMDTVKGPSGEIIKMPGIRLNVERIIKGEVTDKERFVGIWDKQGNLVAYLRLELETGKIILRGIIVSPLTRKEKKYDRESLFRAMFYPVVKASKLYGYGGKLTVVTESESAAKYISSYGARKSRIRDVFVLIMQPDKTESFIRESESMWKTENVILESDTYSIQKLTLESQQLYRLIDKGSNSHFDIAPGIGATVTSFNVDGTELLFCPNVKSKRGIPFMWPWAGRLQGTSFDFEGRTIDLSNAPNTTKDENGNLIHGLVRTVSWLVTEFGSNENGVFIKCQLDTKYYPAIEETFGKAVVTLTYILRGTELSINVEIINKGDKSFPMSLGFHPWFLTPDRDNWKITVPAETHWLTNGQLLPYENPAEVTGTGFDLRKPTRLRGKIFDNVFTGLNSQQGVITSILRNTKDNRTIKIVQDGNFRHIVVYVPGNIKDVVCVEPQSSAPNPFKLKGATPVILKPGERFNGKVSIRASQKSANKRLEELKLKQKQVTERFIDTVKGVAAKEKGQKIILALDTDIGDMTQFEIRDLLKQIKDVSGLLGEIEFVADNGVKLPEEIGNTITDITGKGVDRKNIEVIVVTNKTKEDFNDTYHVTRVDDVELLGTGSYVPILELLTFALEINLNEVDDEVRKLYIDITGMELTDGLIEQIRKGIFAIPLPKTEKIPKDFYDKSVEILSAA